MYMCMYVDVDIRWHKIHIRIVTNDLWQLFHVTRFNAQVECVLYYSIAFRNVLVPEGGLIRNIVAVVTTFRP